MQIKEIKEIKEEFKRALEETLVIRETFKEPEQMANHLLDCFCEKLKTEAMPDKVEIRSSIAGGLPRLVAIKALPEPVKDAWNQEEYCDVVCIKKIGNIIADEETLIREGMKQLVKFFLLTQKEQEEAISLLKGYMTLDVEDIHGPLLAALIACRTSDDSPSEEWNVLVKKLWKAYLRRAREETRKRKEKQQELLQELLDFISSHLRVEESKWEEDEYFISLVIKIQGKEFRFNEPGLKASYIEAKKRKLLEYLQHCEYHEEAKERAEKVKSGVIPAVQFIRSRGSPYFRGPAQKEVLHEIYYKNGILKVPENLMGHVIGSGGRNIKSLSHAVGRFVKIVKIPPIEEDRKAKVLVEGLSETPDLKDYL